MTERGFRVEHLDRLERVPLEEGTWRPIRRALGITGVAVNAYTADTGAPVIEDHDETGPGSGHHQEVYVVVAGSARFAVDGEPVDAPSGTVLVVEPASRRSATAVEDETTVLVVGGPPGAALPPSPFEYWYAAIPAHESRDHQRAYEITAEGLEHYPEHGTIHYSLACELALLGRSAEAIEHLRAAFENDPRTRGWASEDSELDSLRELPGYPD